MNRIPLTENLNMSGSRVEDFRQDGASVMSRRRVVAHRNSVLAESSHVVTQPIGRHAVESTGRDAGLSGVDGRTFGRRLVGQTS